MKQQYLNYMFKCSKFPHKSCKMFIMIYFQALHIKKPRCVPRSPYWNAIWSILSSSIALGNLSCFTVFISKMGGITIPQSYWKD